MRHRHSTICLALIVAIASNVRGFQPPYQESFPKLHGPYLGQMPPGDVPEVFCAGFLTPPDGFHSSITFSPDLREAYWTSQGGHTFRSVDSSGYWSIPTELKFDSLHDVGDATLSVDGQHLYFLSRRLSVDDPVERERIWYVEREDDGWSPPRLVDRAVWRHPTHWTFSLAANGNLYFTSERAGVRGSGDIYIATWDGQRFLEPVDLGAEVNSDLRDFCPFTAPDESYLIFVRAVPEEGNRSDLFICFKDAEGNWLPAINMGDTVNSKHNEVCPVVTPDGRYLFYSSVSGERNVVLWVDAEIIERLRREVLQ